MYAAAKKHFKKTDARLHQAALLHDMREIAPTSDLFRDIIWTIVGQQLSSRAADAIFARFKRLFPRGRISARKILALSDRQMRGCGLSGAKTRAIRNVAGAVRRKELDVVKLAGSADEYIVAELTKIKGIGPWTAHMVLMFSLGRPDVFSPGDLGLRKGVMQLYRLKKFPDERKLLKIVAPWSPYRTYAARVLWKVADAQKNRVGRARPDAR